MIHSFMVPQSPHSSSASTLAVLATFYNTEGILLWNQALRMLKKWEVPFRGPAGSIKGSRLGHISGSSFVSLESKGMDFLLNIQK